MSANHQKQSTVLTPARLRKVDAWWRAANYLSVGENYRYDNPIQKQPLTLAHTEPRRLGHGATPLLPTPSRATHRPLTLSEWFRNTS